MYYNIYKHAPVFIQNILCTGYGYKEKRIRFGKRFDFWRNKLAGTDTFGKGEIEAYQNEKLKEIVSLAYHNVPYYNSLFKENNLQPADISRISDLKKIPLTTKEDLRMHKEDFLNQNFKKNDLIPKKTSGTTGKSLSFYSTRDAISFQWAVWWRHRSRFGFNFGDKHLNFTGKPVVPAGQSKPPYWRWNRAFNQAIISMQMVSKEKMPPLINFIEKNEFKYWIGYPSIIHDFCLKILENGYTLQASPDVIFFGAENLLEVQKKAIQKVTGATLTDQYGFTEGCGNASHCEKLNHHEDFEFGIIECHDGELLQSGETRGKIVCTGFANKAFPLIRYEVGDIGVWNHGAAPCACGRKSEVLSRIEGRIDDYVVTPDGKKIMRFDYIFKDTTQISEAQIVQEKLDEIKINIVKRDDYSTETENEIKAKVKKYISTQLDIKFNYIPEIPREENGKFRAVKSKLK